MDRTPSVGPRTWLEGAIMQNILSIARSLESLPRALQILNTNLKIGAISKPLGEQIQNKISPTKR